MLGIGVNLRTLRSSVAASAISAYYAGGIKPELVFDFENEKYFTDSLATTFDDAVTYSRASSATYVDSNGVLQTAGINEPRIGHHVWDGTSWVNKGLLHESEARTNLVTYSEDFTDASWGEIGGVSVTADQATAPDGQVTADLVEGPSAAIDEIRSTIFSITAGDAYCVSIFVSNNDSQNSRFLFREDGTGDDFVDISWSGGVPTLSGGGTLTKTIEKAGNGYYRLSLSRATDATSTLVSLGFQPDRDAAGRGVYLWGAQIEEASTPSSYTPTSGATVTRAADSLTVPSANLPWSSDAVSIQMQGRMTYADTDSAAEAEFFRWYFDGNNRIQSYLRTNVSPNDIRFQQGVSGTFDTSDGGSYSPGVNVPFNIASRHGSTFINGAVDGTALTADTTPTALPDLSATDLQLGYDYMGTIKMFRVWADDLADTGIEEASS